jgi:hypothetical protein
MPSSSGVLTDRALNRALLARQGLLHRWDIPAIDAIERLVGMQAQAPNAPYVGLWTRLTRFDTDELSQLMTQRAVVRIALMRSTLFLVSARDCLALRPVLQSVSDRSFASNSGTRVQGLDVAALVRRSRQLLEQRPMPSNELGSILAREFPGYDPTDLERQVRTSVPLVQVPPRGLWGRSMVATHTTAEHWLGAPLAADTGPDEVIHRYLAAFGPATIADMQTWSGLAGLRTQVERLRPTLRTFANEQGQELFDVPDGLLPDPDTPTPVRILPEFDNVLLSHANRSRIFCDAVRIRFMTNNGLVRSTVLVDGFVRGVCVVRRGPDEASAVIEAFGTLPKKDEAAVRAEARKLLMFVAPGARHTVRVE